MGKVPYLFCRYTAHIDDELLDASGLTQALTEIQGTYFAHGAKAEREGRKDVVVMRPRQVEIAGETAVTWAIGHVPGQRTVTNYDAANQEIQQRIEADDNIVHTHILALPRLGVMAINDRVSAMHMGARSALSRTRSAFRHMAGGSFTFWFLQPGDVSNVLDQLSLKEYSFTVRRINPTPPGALSAALDASMEAEGIGVYRGVSKPMPGGEMHRDEGVIGQTAELAEGGYGVVGFKGETDAGSVAQIRKPPFSMEKSENIKQMEKEQPLRVFVEDGEDDEVMASVVAELVRFYGGDDASDILEEPA
ncbi:MAG: hypothetical protein KDE32_13355 [Novosphingobium sp.]|nr:hypothetical protein [Novosphingobium sp.]